MSVVARLPATASMVSFTSAMAMPCRAAASRSISTSSPKTFTARSLFTPEMSSFTRKAMGCENESRSPGICPSSFCIASTSSALSRPVPHSRRGLSMTKTSFCSGPIGSSEISARPVLVTTVSTSGKRRRRFSMKVPTATEPSSEAFGSRTTLMAMAFSSSGGMNSVPTSGTAATAPASSATETPRVTAGLRIERSSSRR